MVVFPSAVPVVDLADLAAVPVAAVLALLAARADSVPAPAVRRPATPAAVTRIAQASRLQLLKQRRSLLNVQTFHSFFWDLLKTHSYLLGTPRRIRILMPQDERVRNGNAKNEEGSQGWAAWVKEREVLFLQEGLVGFDLFATKAAEILQRSPLIRQLLAERFPLIIVDEAQDTGPDAWRCVEIRRDR